LSENGGTGNRERRLQPARKRHGAENVLFVVADAAALPFEDASFDTAAIARSIHHMPDPSIILREMARVLRPGGRLLITEMVADAATRPRSRLCSYTSGWPMSTGQAPPTHGWTFFADQILRLVEQLGLVEIEQKLRPGTCLRGGRLVAGSRLAADGGTDVMVVACEKDGSLAILLGDDVIFIGSWSVDADRFCVDIPATDEIGGCFDVVLDSRDLRAYEADGTLSMKFLLLGDLVARSRLPRRTTAQTGSIGASTPR